MGFGVELAKAHAYGNDFLIVRASELTDFPDLPAVVRKLCDRHRGIGADGVMIIEETPAGADTRLFNADGSTSELSGNGVRCVGTVLSFERNMSAGDAVTIGTGAGPKVLTFLGAKRRCLSFRASMGPPEDMRKASFDVAGQRVEAVVMRVGNPQCVVLGPQPDDERFRRLGSALEKHAIFPQGTNVEFATVGDPRHVTIRIWERGCGPTLSSGTGSCASLVAAAAYGGAQRDAEVIAPGGTQRVEWLDDGVYLTGWAEVICEGEWSRPLPHG